MSAAGGAGPAGKGPSPEDQIREEFPEAIEDAVQTVDFPTLTIRRDLILPVAQFVKNRLGYRHPACASGVDRRDNLEVVYHVWSLEEQRLLGLKVLVPSERPNTPSLAGVWRGMDWHEREIYDLLGVIFDDHPDLRRILLPDDWKGHPLLKSYTEID